LEPNGNAIALATNFFYFNLLKKISPKFIMKSIFFDKLLDTCVALIEQYDGKMPLSAWLKNYFANHKKHGSTDRKNIAHFCYCYFRVNNAFANATLKEKMIVGLFLCEDNSQKYIENLPQNLRDSYLLTTKDKIKFLQQTFAISASFFKWQHYISDKIDEKLFIESHLKQPNLFLRIRPNCNEKVVEKLLHAAIDFKTIATNCLQLSNTTKIDSIVNLNKEVVVQDYSSQQVQNMFGLILHNTIKTLQIWDCCAASGGKSILAIDSLSTCHITATDIRPTIVEQLKKRLFSAGVFNSNIFIDDAISPKKINKKFDIIICDVPCSGSGTWGRTPERISFFKDSEIETYQNLQLNIAKSVSKYLLPNGYLLYITCSVFAKENEEVITQLLQNNNQLSLVTSTYYEGSFCGADTMFAALLLNN
jgi:16S rRNA (cytosine967-C5)-methyltransferase